MCNIGKSVNHLRAHKNLEIQKKARSLVDTWKKRVEAEMNINDAKSGSSQAVAWSSRPRLSEVSHGGNRHSGGSSEIAMKSSVTQLSSSKTALVKLVQGEIAKSGSAPQGFTKSATSPTSVSASLKDGQTRVAGVGKEDARSSTAMSMSVSRTSGGASRHRKSVNGCPKLAVFGVQRETGSSRSSSFQRNPASEKISRSGLTCYKGICFCYFERGKVERKKRLCRYCVIRLFSYNRRRVVDAALLFAALAIGFAWWRRRKPQEQFFDVPAEDDPEVHLRQFKRISLRALQVATGE